MIDMVAYADRIPDPGETLVGATFSLGFGGKGANQAVMCALLDSAVRFVGCLGQDRFGQMALDNLNSFGIDTSAVSFDNGAATGAASIWVDATGENRIVIVPGANEMLDPDAVEAAVRTADADVVLTQLELPEHCVERALRTANEVGSISILNPAPMRPVAPEVLSLATWLIPNQAELEAIAELLGVSRETGAQGLAGDVAHRLETRVVVTAGAHGALVAGEGRAGVTVVESPQTSPVDTTGAGDAFVGAFAYAIALGAAPVQAAAFGCACASASVELPGTQTSFPRGARLEALLGSFRGDSGPLR